MITKQKLLWIFFGLSAIGIGLYPIIYLYLDSTDTGLLGSKPRDLIENGTYLIVFYIHIILGGVSLLAGWSQFIKSWRNKYLSFHRALGYVYVTSVFISSIAGFIISPHSTGGIVSALGFGSLAVLWFTSNLLALVNIIKGRVQEHEKWMIRNYAMTFGAVTLRFYLPILMIMSKGDIEFTLRVVSWISWVPNLIVMEIYIQGQFSRVLSSKYPMDANAKDDSPNFKSKRSEMVTLMKKS